MAVRKVDAWSLDCISYASLVALLDRPAYVERIEYKFSQVCHQRPSNAPAAGHCFTFM